MRFALQAPDARAVSLVGEMNEWRPGATPMTRGADGTWSVTVALAPGQWLYKFHVDGEWVPDPGSPLSSPDGRGGRHTWVIVGQGDFRRREGVPHGRLEVVQVPSRALGASIEASLYVPPATAGARLPLLVLLHGHGSDRLQWVDNGLIADFMDNLVDAGRVRPFLVAMPSIMPHADRPELMDFLGVELPEWLEQSHHAAPGRGARALGGFSMGGGLTLLVSAAHPEAYGRWFALAPGLRDWAFERLNERLRDAGPIAVYCGVDDEALPVSRRIATLLRAQGANLEVHEVPGAHSFRFLNAVTPGILEAASTGFSSHSPPQ